MLRTKYILLGVLVSICGSIIAATVSVPHQFSSGQMAIASEVNANFSALSSALNLLDQRVLNLETSSPGTSPQNFAVSQVDLAVGSTVVVSGTTYTIAQVEVPRFDTDEIYLLKFPSKGNYLSEIASETIQVSGGYSGGYVGFDSSMVTTLSGFDVLIGERHMLTTTFQVSNSGRSVSNSHYHYISAYVLLGPETSVTLYFASPSTTSQGTSVSRSSDASGIATIYPPVSASSVREQKKLEMRDLLKYVSLVKKT